jgi:hypothetical protein
VKSIGYAKGENRHRFILRYFNDPDPELKTAALEAAGNTAHGFTLLIDELKEASP